MKKIQEKALNLLTNLKKKSILMRKFKKERDFYPPDYYSNGLKANDMIKRIILFIVVFKWIEISTFLIKWRCFISLIKIIIC